jgi:hypothetical protein
VALFEVIIFAIFSEDSDKQGPVAEATMKALPQVLADIFEAVAFLECTS